MTSQQPELSEYDFLELAAFDAKVDWEGFDYAYEEYPPRFEAAELLSIAQDYSKLRSLRAAYLDKIRAFWDQEDAQGKYDRHLTAADNRMARRRMA
ncbi:hypothetical protein EAO71_27345 [Streptomyces sp. ms191]|uniref:hypothetical protein n=1 Tax=Streptomyces sp. ms191 TaxID=1827978 RepID=UPI0011CDC61B|nr:hypothetical protein [Streptomyces sp. ms191]TXS21418.1 hypothetical protein EAO71_27345 [Streptomyces sp. ms191]